MPLIIHNPTMAPRESTIVIDVPERFAREVISPASRYRNLRSALVRWNRSGRKITPRDVRQARRIVCDVCPHWRPDGNLGLGECTAPGCGCTRAKIWLAPEKCPLGKWPAQENQ